MLNKIIFCLLLTGSVAQAQQTLKPDPNTRVCGSVSVLALEGKDYRVTPAGLKQKQMIEKVCKLIWGSAVNFTILATADVPNAIALISNGQRYILYNYKFINQLDENQDQDVYLANLCLLAHEMGHHVHGHALTQCQGTACQKDELDADAFAGCALLRAQAAETDLERATQWMSPQGDAEHPPRTTRQAMVRQGYLNCKTTPRDCEKNRNGEIWFRNKTGKAIEVILENDSNIKTTIEVNGTGVLMVPAGTNRFRINRESALWHDANNPTRGTMMRYKDETHRVVQCAENPPPIDIF